MLKNFLNLLYMLRKISLGGMLLQLEQDHKIENMDSTKEIGERASRW
jgi:hypothetical protein